jgi:tetratricopeptide (TPR) repeat protein
VKGAGRVLEAYGGARGASWHLRAGLVAAHQGRLDQARAELAAAHLDELGSEERGWQFFLQGMLADAANESLRAAGFYGQAASSAVSDLQRARFLLAAEQARLRVGTVTDDQLENDRKNAEKFQAQKIGYGFTREYAIALNALGRRGPAIEVLQNALRTLPRRRTWRPTTSGSSWDSWPAPARASAARSSSSSSPPAATPTSSGWRSSSSCAARPRSPSGSSSASAWTA